MSQPLLWDHMTVEQIGQALLSTQTVLIPCGCVEQHGYHLPTRTDCYTAEAICAGASARTGAIVAPTVAYTYSGGELPGTINISTPVVSLLVSEILRDLSRQGWRNLVLVLGHGGTENEQAMYAAADMFLRTHPDRAGFNVAIYKMWEHSALVKEAVALRDFHAGYVETSIVLALAPQDVQDKRVLDGPDLLERMRADQDNYQLRTKNAQHPDVVPHIHQNPEIKVGVMGILEGASADLGHRIIGEGVEGLVELIECLEA